LDSALEEVADGLEADGFSLDLGCKAPRLVKGEADFLGLRGLDAEA